VARITSSLFWRDVLNAPLSTREMAAWGCVLLCVFLLGGVVVPYLFP
jgi:hypothetical protein